MISTYATQIRRARERARITRSELARRLGTTYAQLWAWESGTNTPRDEMIARINAVLGLKRRKVPPHDIV